MSARLPTLFLLLGLLAPNLTPRAAAACPECETQARRAAEKKTAAMVRSSLYAICGLPAGLMLDQLGLGRELANRDFVLPTSRKCLVGACTQLSDCLAGLTGRSRWVAKADAASPVDRAAQLGALVVRCKQAVEAGDHARAEHLMLKATWRLHQMQRKAGAISTEEAEEAAAPCPADSGAALLLEEYVLPSTNDTVDALLQKCHQALSADRCDLALGLARQALALDPIAVAANALVYRTHLFVQLRDKVVEPQKCDEVKEILRLLYHDRPEKSEAETIYPGCVQGPVNEQLPRLVLVAEEACEEKSAAAPVKLTLEMDIPCFDLPVVGKLVLQVGESPQAPVLDAVEEEAEDTRFSGLVRALEGMLTDGPSLEFDCCPFGGEFRIGCHWQGDTLGFRCQYNQAGRGGLRLSVEVPVSGSGEVDD